MAGTLLVYCAFETLSFSVDKFALLRYNIIKEEISLRAALV